MKKSLIVMLAAAVLLSSCRWITRQKAQGENFRDEVAMDDGEDYEHDWDNEDDGDQAEELPDYDIFLSDGYFNMDQTRQSVRKRLAGLDACAIFRDSDTTFVIMPVALTPSFSRNECTGDTDVAIATDKGGPESYIAVIAGLKSYNKVPFKGIIPTEGDMLSIDPGKQLRVSCEGTNYILHAEAESVPDCETCWRKYSLMLSVESAASRQIAYIPRTDDNTASLVFAGDIDGDGKPDLILQQGAHYESHRWVLYLSSYAESDEEIVRAVAVDDQDRSC